MVAKDPNKILKVPGQLVVNPTDLSIAFPHGGTALGNMKEVKTQVTTGNELITDEEHGISVVDSIYLGEAWALAALMRDFDADALSNIFPSVFTSTLNSKLGLKYPNANIPPGTLMSSRTVVLLFSPNNLDRHPMLIMRRAIPMPAETLELAQSFGEAFEPAVIFIAIEDTNAAAIEMNFRSEMSV